MNAFNERTGPEFRVGARPVNQPFRGGGIAIRRSLRQIPMTGDNARIIIDGRPVETRGGGGFWALRRRGCDPVADVPAGGDLERLSADLLRHRGLCAGGAGRGLPGGACPGLFRTAVPGRGTLQPVAHRGAAGGPDRLYDPGDRPRRGSGADPVGPDRGGGGAGPADRDRLVCRAGGTGLFHPAGDPGKLAAAVPLRTAWAGADPLGGGHHRPVGGLPSLPSGPDRRNPDLRRAAEAGGPLPPRPAEPPPSSMA